MSRPRFLADHDFNEDILKGLLRQEPTIELVRAREVGLQQTPDVDVLAYAAAQGWVVLSHDVNTMSAAAVARLQAGQPMTGLVMVRQQAYLAPSIEDLLII
jgi:predicted nuclease of predicted toxin-antitoxin system